VDTDRSLSLLFGATDQPDGMSSRMTVVIDKAGKIIKHDKQVNANAHGEDLIGFFESR
jgi:peroxiredoxin